MENLLISIGSILIGVIATIIVSRHYYRRSVDMELTPFIQLQSNVLSHIDKEVKSDLHIEYKGVKVENLQQLQFLIANTGERVIRDTIKPLRLSLPQDIEIMDAAILYVAPNGREVTLNTSKPANSIEISFPLLNKDEFFILKLLLNGAPSSSDLRFTIVADDLPPQLDIHRLTDNQIEKEEKADSDGFMFGLFVFGIILSTVAFFLGILAHYIKTDSFPAIQSESWVWVNSIPLISISSLIAYMVAGILAFIGAMAITSSVFGIFEFTGNKKFRLPREFATVGYGLMRMDQKYIISKHRNVGHKKHVQPKN